MNREFLEELGLEKEAIDKVMAEHGKAIQSVKPSDDYEKLKEKNSELEGQLSNLQDTLKAKETELEKVDELNKRIENYELNELKASIARQANIPHELASRLSGTTEEELKADAESLAGLVKAKQTLPLKPTEPDVNSKDLEMEQMLDELTGKQ